MRHLLPIAAVLLLPAVASGGEIAGMGARGKADNKQFEFPLHADEVKATPAWTSNSPCPPLEPRRAIEIATKQLRELVKEPAKWYFVQLELVQFSGDHWAYIVIFDRHYPEDVAVTFGDFFQIPVLMSGATLQPRVTALPPDVIEHSK
jgi:hypothetical protein